MPHRFPLVGLTFAIASIFILISANPPSAFADGPSEYLPSTFQTAENTPPNIARNIKPVALSDRDYWTINQISGEVRQDNGNRVVAVGDRAVTGTRLVTGTGGRVVLVRRNDKITMSPNSDMKVGDNKGDKLFTNIIQSIGTLLFQVEKNPRQRFQVATPYLAAIVKGTTFTVSVGAEGAAVHVTDGAVRVASLGGQRAVIVRPGQTGSVSSKPGAEVEIHKREGKNRPAADAKADTKEAKKNSDKGESKNAANRNQPAQARVPSNSSGKGDAKSTRPAKRLARAVGIQPVDFAELTKGFAGNSTIGGNRGKSNVSVKKGKANVDVVFRSASPSSGNGGGGNGGNGRDSASLASGASGAALASVPSGNSGRSGGTGNSSSNSGSNGGGNSIKGGSSSRTSVASVSLMVRVNGNSGNNGGSNANAGNVNANSGGSSGNVNANSGGSSSNVNSGGSSGSVNANSGGSSGNVNANAGGNSANSNAGGNGNSNGKGKKL